MTFLYVGAYTEPQGRAEGIGVYCFDHKNGALDHVQTVTDITNPSFLAVSPDGRFLYAVCESEGGAVAALSRDPESGKLVELNRQSSGGNGPCYVSVEASGRYALVANYGGGSIAALPIAADGSLEPATSVVQHEGSSVNPDRQGEAHAHMIAPTPDGLHVFTTDLGMDEIVGYSLDAASGQLVPNGEAGATSHPGAGPRHFAFAPDSGMAFVINELDSTLTACDYDAETGRLDSRQTVSTLPDTFDGENTTAHILVSPDGRFVYGSNRGHDSIAIFAIHPESHDLIAIGHASSRGRTPRNFALDPSGEWLLAANQDSDTVVAMRRNARTGLLSDPETVSNIASAVCLVFCE